MLLYTLNKPSGQCGELSGRARGSCSEVWALHVAILARGNDLYQF